MSRKLRTYHTVAIFETLTSGIIQCPIELIGTKIFTDEEFSAYANAKLDSIDKILNTKKKITMVDITGIKRTIYDRDILKITVGTVEIVHNPLLKTAKPMFIEFNNDVL